MDKNGDVHDLQRVKRENESQKNETKDKAVGMTIMNAPP
jgi:hypothetical protein